MLSKKFLSLAIIAAVGATAANAQSKFEKVETVENWTIWKDLDKMSCFMERLDEAGNVVQMGLTADHSLGYVGVFTKAETDLKAGENTEIQLIVGERYYKGEAQGMRGNISNGYSGGYFLSASENLAEDIAKQYVMTVFPDREYAFEVNLDGTLKGMAAARSCNENF